ncbi:MAG: serine/threonine protein kinase [Planctomycetota bacterium]|nr:serine/threonine protein kinase [Planctomycetota bacterium]
MAGDPFPGEAHRVRLQRVRDEIERELGQGITFSADDWLRRYPELGLLIQEITGAGRIQVAVRPSVDATGNAETIATSSSRSPGASPAETIALSTPSRTSAPSNLDVTMDHPSSDTEATVGSLGNDETRPGGAEVTGPAPGQKVRYIGDYETISILGQGGMGVVYQARQISLNRLVALKMIRNAEFASDDQVRRFQNEAEAVATLDHPGIVPIYEVGTYEDQRYFSMKMVDGHGLDKKLDELARDPRAAVRVVAEVVDAVNHAHQRGILHRDLKPANILVDTQGHAHVTDFGLAKRIEEDAGLTVSGAIMGTPSYMAPEQAAGRSSLVTTSSDVYGLGAILYAVLTGRAPFASDSVLNTLDQVRNVAPQAPTRFNAKLPRDLEVICLKCLEKDPRHRYASAQALSDDLNRWLRGEPIAARPVGPVVRLRMWAKRKPALAGLSAALIAASILGVIGITWQWREAVAQRNKAQVARDEAMASEKAARNAETKAKTARDEAVASETKAVASEKQAIAARALAEQNAMIAGKQATLALNSIQDMIVQVRTNLNGRDLFDVKTTLLENALKRVDGVASVYEQSTSKEATALAAMTELANIYRELGQSEKAFHMLERCLAIAKARVKIKEYSDPSRQNLANVYRDLAIVSEEYQRDMKVSLFYNEASLKIWEDVFKNPKLDQFALDKKIVRYFLAEAYTRVAVSRYRGGEVARARDFFLKAYNLRRELVAELPEGPHPNQVLTRAGTKQDLSYSIMALAETSFRLGDKAQADDHYRQALELREATFKATPKDPRAGDQLAGVNYMIGEFKLKTGDLPAARRYLERSKDLRMGLLQSDPKNTIHQRDLSISLYRLGNLADREKDEKAAAEAFETARKLQQQLVDLDEHNDKRLLELMTTLAHVGQTDKAAAIADRLNGGPKVDNELRLEIARCYAQCARSTPINQNEPRQTFLVKAMETLRTTVVNGFRDRVYLETEPDLEPIRNRDDFKQILADIRPG